MSDLDDEELIATRKLNGLDDGLYESDKNVVNIEDDIKYIKECLKILRVVFNAIKKETDFKEIDDIAFCKAVEHILAEREQDKKRIKELEEHQKKFYNGELYTAKQLKNIEKNQNKYFINRQKVKDKIDEINKKYEDSKDENGESPYYYPEYTIRVLKKLLEEK